MTKSIRFKTMTAFVCSALMFACGGSKEEAPDTAEQDVAPVERSNQAPKLSRIWFEPETPTPGGVLYVKTSASDPDGDPVRFSYAWRANGRALTEAGEMINLTNLTRGDHLEVTVSASDGKATSETKSLTVTLGNQAPVVQSIHIAFSGGEGAQSGTLVATPTAKDSDGDELTFLYRWAVDGKEVDGAGQTFDTAPYGKGEKFQVTVIANDGELDSLPLMSDPIEMMNRPPHVVSTPPSVNAEGEFRYQVKAEDPDGDRLLRYSLGQGPEGMTVDSVSGEVVWKPSEKQVGTHSIVIAVKDSQGAVGLQEFRLDIKLTEAAPPPVVEPKPAPDEEAEPKEVSEPTETPEPVEKPEAANTED